mmetsp:Transcript_2814/g.2975  ORF Transcript_2814/g.2975 Transcript_2814/m.2975 type:complete len:97 (+) Transcript_2814:28-318(+)
MFANFFQDLCKKDITVTVQLKNDLEITGTLVEVDGNMNYNLANVKVSDPEKHPHLLNVKTIFIRGSTVKYVHLPSSEIDINGIQEECRTQMGAKAR